MPIVKCPAYQCCNSLGTARASCEDLWHHFKDDKKLSPELAQMKETNSRLTEIQACLSSLVLSISRLPTE